MKIEGGFFYEQSSLARNSCRIFTKQMRLMEKVLQRDQGFHKRITRSPLEAEIERRGKMIHKSIKKNTGFGFLALFGCYLVCLFLPTLANARVGITTTDKKYIILQAESNLQKFQDETIDSLLPDYIGSSLQQYRELLKRVTKIDEADKSNETEIKKLAVECEKIFNDLNNAIKKRETTAEETGRIGSLDDCLFNCGSTNLRRINQTEKDDWFGRFNCNLDASSCVFGCYVDVANDERIKGGIPKD